MIHSKLKANSIPAQYIVSIDIGIVYFAYVTLDLRHQTIIDWRCMTLPHIQHNGKYILDSDHTIYQWENHKFGIPGTHVWEKGNVDIIVEEQVASNKDMRQVTDILQTFSKGNGMMLRYMDTYARINYMAEFLDSKITRQSSRLAVKKETCHLVRSCILEFVCKEIATVFRTAYKKDDLADCMIQLLAAIKQKPSWLLVHNESNRNNNRNNKEKIKEKIKGNIKEKIKEKIKKKIKGNIKENTQENKQRKRNNVNTIILD